MRSEPETSAMRAPAAFNRETRAFVLGLGTNGLGAVRSLGEVGIGVTGLDWEGGAPGFKSRYCQAIRCAHPISNPDQVLDQLLRASDRYATRPVLIPTTDVFVHFMSLHRAQLAERFLFALPDGQILEALVNKRLQYELAERIGTPYPRTFYPESAEDVASMKHDVEYPALLKPYYSHLWHPIFGNKGFPVSSPDELERRFAQVLPSRLPVVVQSVIPGPSSNLYSARIYIDLFNRPLAVFTTHKIRQHPMDYGISTFAESVRSEEVGRLGLDFLQGVQYRGIGCVEFKRDARDGKFKMIELNARLTGSNILARHCGVNFPLITYLDLTGQEPKPCEVYRVGVKWLDAVNDFQAFWSHHRRGELSFFQWVRSIASARSFAHFDWRDPLPFLTANDYGLKYARLPLYLMRYWRGRPDSASTRKAQA